jgi:peptidoglycan-associated lipoprotein
VSDALRPLEILMPRPLIRALTVLLATGGLALAAACGGNPPPAQPAPPPPPPPAQVVEQPPPPPPPTPPQPPPPTPAPPTEEEIFARMSLEALNQQGNLGDVFFEYDQADLSATARATLDTNATWLRRWTSTRISVEGHADSRGTNEYNLALGERRAAAIKDYLASLGIADARVAIVSKGEEEPVCPDDVESCWSRNRRGHFIITAK